MSDYISKAKAIDWLKDAKDAGCVDRYSDAIRRDHFDEAIETIESMPTVNAIPIDWLKKKYPLTGVVGTESYFRTAHIVDELIKEWEAEKKEEYG